MLKLLPLLCILLAACSWEQKASSLAKVKKINIVRNGKAIETNNERFHIVQSGDTLFSIARQYNLDVSQLQQQNGGETSLTVGQTLSLTGPIMITKAPTPKPQALAANNTVTLNPNKVDFRCNWPVKGKLAKKAQALEIKVAEESVVKAAAPGEVVYSGNGLKGYGHLIIIKHNAEFLTAYAHNKELKVREGQKVIAGQAIAALDKGASLHFEVRKNGTPVNPELYLNK